MYKIIEGVYVKGTIYQRVSVITWDKEKLEC